MRNPFDSTSRGRARNKLLGVDSWIDDSLYRLFNSTGEWWESVVIFFRRFHVSGFRKFVVEILDEGFTMALAGAVVLLGLALPAFDETSKDWRSTSDFAVTFLDRYGKEIGRRGIRQTDSEEIDALPDHFIKAVLATEDRRFFDHFGIDLLGLSRAMVVNVQANSVVQGGSTITQQLAKNLFLSNERTIDRKIKEAFLALWLESNLTKKEILKLYLDRAYMGGGNFGITAAAQYYFDKPVKDLSLAEAAMLAGLYKAPTKYAPHINLPAARARANEVLTNMVQSGFMTEGQVIGARRKPASIVERSDTEGPNYFMDYAFEEIKRIAAGLPTRTFIAKTTVDLDLQRVAEESIESHLRQYGEQYKASEAAMVAIDHDGAVRAMVGGLDYGVSQFNRAISSRRQPGSSFKPFVYAAAVETFGYDENTKVIDGPVSTGKWSPKNYSGGYGGAMTLTTALVKSYNTVPVKLYLGRDGLKGLGGKRIDEIARKMGVVSPMVLNPPMVLGSNGLTVLEMAASYGTFMTGGMKLDAHAITQITDSSGNVLYDYRKDRPAPVRALSERTVGVMNRMMAQIPEWGTAQRAALDGIRAAGKTGTTSSYRDAWFVGFTGNYVAAVWYGNDDYTTMNRMTGGTVPAMTWKRFMTYAHQNIDLLPVPFIENPLPGGVKDQPEEPSGEEMVQGPAAPRPKLLSRGAQEMLLELERKLREAKPVSANQVMASDGSGPALAR
ncbi:MAG: PBP1A family penicillin-binding protein [Nitratireductor sp.]|nr:PBP1A family penicillin-binding protein [Nitratireductor sp.]